MRVRSEPKTYGSTPDIPLLPAALDVLRRLTRKLNSDGSEYVFTTPEGKPMTDSWWPKRGAARRVDPAKPESYGMWFRCLRSLGIRVDRGTYIARRARLRYQPATGC